MTNLDMGRGIAPFTITLTFLAVVMLVGPINTARADFNFTKIVDTHTPVPGGGGANFNFNGSDVPAVSGDRVVFDTADMTIWTATRSGNGLRKLITSRTRIPGGWGRFRQFFGNYVQIHGEIIVVIADN